MEARFGRPAVNTARGVPALGERDWSEREERVSEGGARLRAFVDRGKAGYGQQFARVTSVSTQHRAQEKVSHRPV